MRLKRDPNRFIVLEGNRRLVALRALENPEAFKDAVDPGVLKELRKLSKEYQQNPVEKLLCVVVKERKDAHHWIRLRHTGENEGAGIVTWGSDESNTFNVRVGGVRTPFHMQILSFLETEGALPPETRKALPTTSFKRLVETPLVREKLGVELTDGNLELLADKKAIVKALRYVVDDLASKKKKVGDIYTVKQRVEYAENLPANIVVTPTKQKGSGTKTDGGASKTKKKAKAKKKSGKRDRLIPSDCILNISEARISDIAEELQHYLSLNSHTNAVSVMFRVFLELSVDAYIENEKWKIPERANLHWKMEKVLDDLLKKQKLSAAQATPVRRALQRDSFLATTVDMMHAYIHNLHVFPQPGDLRAGWNNLQPFIVAISS